MPTDARTTPDYWKKETGRFVPFRVDTNPFARELDRFLPMDPELSCVEIGAYPGGNLCYLAKRFGYRAHAIEYRDDADDIKRLFEFNGLEAPEIIHKDFLTVEGRSFDVVASFGFIEHFNNTCEVLEKHCSLIVPGGYLVLSVPHFWGMQGFIRKLLFCPEAVDELYATHNMAIMHLSSVKEALRKAGLEILFLEHVMNGRFWISPDSPKIRPDRKWMARGFARLDRLLGGRLPSCVLFSPMILAVCKKG